MSHSEASTSPECCHKIDIWTLQPRDHVTPAVQQLHWLPLYYRIQCKVCLLMYSASHQHYPAYQQHGSVCRHFVSEMTYYVSSGTLNHTYSLILHIVMVSGLPRA